MEASWEKMSSEEFAAYERILGQKVVKVNGIHWAQVRPCFYRPLLPFREYEPGSIRAPRPAYIGGFQHAVPVGSTSNAFLNVRMLDDARSYSLKTLDSEHRRYVRLASEHFVIRPIKDVNEFKQKAYSAYRSFYERTQYRTGSERRQSSGFSRWADALFQFPKIAVMGAYQGDKLGGINVSMLVEDTVIGTTAFCDSESLRMNIMGFMLHAVLQAAAADQDVERVYAGMYTGERGLDGFFTRRGVKLVRKPALLQVNPLAMVLLRHSAPNLHAKLLGEMDGSGELKQSGGTPH